MLAEGERSKKNPSSQTNKLPERCCALSEPGLVLAPLMGFLLILSK